MIRLHSLHLRLHNEQDCFTGVRLDTQGENWESPFCQGDSRPTSPSVFGAERGTVDALIRVIRSDASPAASHSAFT